MRVRRVVRRSHAGGPRFRPLLCRVKFCKAGASRPGCPLQRPMPGQGPVAPPALGGHGSHRIPAGDRGMAGGGRGRAGAGPGAPRAWLDSLKLRMSLSANRRPLRRDMRQSRALACRPCICAIGAKPRQLLACVNRGGVGPRSALDRAGVPRTSFATIAARRMPQPDPQVDIDRA